MAAVPATILHVEDDSNDALLFNHACKKAELTFELHTVTDGEEAISYLRGDADFSDRLRFPLPQLMILDLKMPRVNGFDVLQWVRSTDGLKQLPIVVLSSSNHQGDVQRAYALGANSFLVKPVSFEALIDLAKSIQGYWLMTNQRIPG